MCLAKHFYKTALTSPNLHATHHVNSLCSYTINLWNFNHHKMFSGEDNFAQNSNTILNFKKMKIVVPHQTTCTFNKIYIFTSLQQENFWVFFFFQIYWKPCRRFVWFVCNTCHQYVLQVNWFWRIWLRYGHCLPKDIKTKLF